MSTFEYLASPSDDELAVLAEIESVAFGSSAPEVAQWFGVAGREHVRAVALRGQVVAGLIVIPMGQYFGGRRVGMTGIAGVAVAPEARGQGAALWLMSQVARELHTAGVGISTLYPATNTLYRKAGWELAGSHYSIEIDARSVGVSERGGVLTAVGEADRAAMRALYADVARTRSGYLDRGPYVWSRVETPRGRIARGTLVSYDGASEGYVYLLQNPLSGGTYDLAITDLCAKTPRAARRLLSFLADHRSMAETLRLKGGPIDPVLWHLPEKSAKVRLFEHWMLRLCNVEAALEQRGYTPGMSARLELELEDDVLPEQAGRYTLEVTAGRGQVTRGGSGALHVGARGLAALFTGFQSAHSLAHAGMLTGDDASLALASGLFASEAPVLPDFF